MKFSVIIPVYFFNEFVYMMLNSIKNQTFSDFEIVIVGNAMTSIEFERISNKIDNILSGRKFIVKYLFTTEKGANNARMLGYNHSVGDYVFFMDSDDQLVSDEVFSSLFQIVKLHNADIISVNLQHATSKDNSLVPKRIIYNYKRADQNLFIDNSKDEKTIIENYGTNIVARLIKRELLEGIHFLNLPYSQDWNVSSKLFLKARSFYFVSLPSYYWVYRDNSISRTASMTPEKHDRAFSSILDIIDYYRKNDVSRKYNYFLYDRIIKFCLRYIDRGSNFDIDTSILRSRNLIEKEVKFDRDFLSNRKIIAFYLLSRYKFLFRTYKYYKKVRAR